MKIFDLLFNGANKHKDFGDLLAEQAKRASEWDDFWYEDTKYHVRISDIDETIDRMKKFGAFDDTYEILYTYNKNSQAKQDGLNSRLKYKHMIIFEYTPLKVVILTFDNFEPCEYLDKKIIELKKHILQDKHWQTKEFRDKHKTLFEGMEL